MTNGEPLVILTGILTDDDIRRIEFNAILDCKEETLQLVQLVRVLRVQLEHAEKERDAIHESFHDLVRHAKATDESRRELTALLLEGRALMVESDHAFALQEDTIRSLRARVAELERDRRPW